MKNKKMLTILILFGIVSLSYSYVRAEENFNNSGDNYTQTQLLDELYYNSFMERFSSFENPYKIIDEDFKNGVINKATWQKSWDYIRSNSHVKKEEKQEYKEKKPVHFKGKIDGYKVILMWDKYEGDSSFLGYKILFTSPSGEQKVISVDASKTQIENWDAKSGTNKYKLVVVGENGDLAYSNEIILSMGSNGGYDFGDGKKSNVNKEEHKNEEYKKTEDKKAQGKEEKVPEKENKDIRQEIREKYEKENSGIQEQNKQNESGALKERHKKLFQKPLESKTANLSIEQIERVLSKIDTAIEKYKSNENLTQNQKVRFIAQLEAIRDILNDKLFQTQDLINIDELFEE